MTDEKKMTNKGALQYVMENCEIPQEVREKLEKMVEQLEKKSSAPKKLTKEQEQNVIYKEQILSVMSTEEGETVTDIMKKLPALQELGYQNQKWSALITQLAKDNKVERTVVKGKSYFRKLV